MAESTLPRPRAAAGAHGGPRLVVFALASLYLAQGIPFGLATEYLPVVLRSSGASYSAIAAFGWLQLPWHFKILWANVADRPSVRPYTRYAILAMQLGLTLTVAAYAIAPFAKARTLWLVLTLIAALFASTQDVFVDAFAVRVLREDERGFGNTAQVAGYRVGMLVGGAALLVLVGSLGDRATLLACAGVVAIASVGAFVGSTSESPVAAVAAVADEATLSAKELIRHLFRREVVLVAIIALTYKLGMHMAGALLKPMAVDYGWSKEQIGKAVVAVGAISALAGAATGGLLHRVIHEKRALFVGLIFQALVCAPLVIVDRLHAPVGLTTFAFAMEHFGTGLGTTILFAAMMTATRPANAGLHYTILTSLNNVAIGVGSQLGALSADVFGKETTFMIATVVCLLPGILLFRWDAAARASRG